jgi:hypothetical protein
MTFRLEARSAWATPRLEARMWFCEDEVCSCTQPQIDRITPNLESGYPWIKRERVWEGVFHSNADAAELAAQRAALHAAAAERGIALDRDDYGTVDA